MFPRSPGSSTVATRRLRCLRLTMHQLVVAAILVMLSLLICPPSCHFAVGGSSGSCAAIGADQSAAFAQASDTESPVVPGQLPHIMHCALCQLGPVLTAIVVAPVLVVLGFWSIYRLLLLGTTTIPTTPPPQLAHR